MTDRLWAKDLAEHLVYLEDFRLVSPLSTEVMSNAIAVPLPTQGCLFKFIPLPNARSRWWAAIQFLPTAWRLVRAVRNAKIIHFGIAGWPYPLGWLAGVYAMVFRRMIVTVVESAPWRETKRTGLKGIIDAMNRIIYETMGRFLVRSSDLPFFTQSAYRQEMLGKQVDRGHVIHASWVDQENLRSSENVNNDWQDRLADCNRPLTVMYAGRLTPSKGIHVLLTVVRMLAEAAVAVQVKVLGEGELEPICQGLAKDLGPSKFQLLGTVEYGIPFFDCLRSSDLVIVPSLGDEQPRIVYDAYSQGVPVMASDTTGLRDCVIHGETGWLIEPGRPDALLEALVRVAKDRSQLAELGKNALTAARRLTHQEMHRQRSELIYALVVNRHMTHNKY